MAEDALVLIFSRNAFYKRLHYLALAVLMLCFAVIIILISILVFLLRTPTHPLFFATDNVGRLIQIVPVNTPNMKLDEVQQWAIDAVQKSYSFDFINYRNQLQTAEKYFTSYGWRNYMNALRESNNLLAVRERRLISIAQVIDKPKVTAQGLLNGSYAWKFEMPLLVSYLQPPDYDEATKFTNALTVTVLVQRQQILEGFQGLGIVQLIGTLPTSTQPQSITNTITG